MRAAIVEAARALIGTPFMHQGRLPGVALDCAGVPIVISWELGLMPRAFDVTGYPAMPDGKTLRAYCEQSMRPVSKAEMQAGDVLLMAWRGGLPQHLGVLVDYQNGIAMVHADSLRHKRVSLTRVEFGRAMQFVAAYALPGVD